MAYTASEITAFLIAAKADLGALMYSITVRENNGESVEKLYLQARILSASILSSDNYNDMTLEEKTLLADMYTNYEELTKGNC